MHLNPQTYGVGVVGSLHALSTDPAVDHGLATAAEALAVVHGIEPMLQG